MREANVREHYKANVFNKSIYGSYRDGVVTTLKQTQRSAIVFIACLALKVKRRPRRIVYWCRRIRRIFLWCRLLIGISVWFRYYLYFLGVVY